MNHSLEESYIPTNGIRLHVIRSGPVDGPPVILLHGFPEFWRGWINQIEPLAQAGYRVIVPDQRGYNLSAVPPQVKSYRISELSKDIVGLMDSRDIKSCFLVGHDWGAAVAWNVALTFPQRVAKLGILNVPHPAVMMNFLKKNPRQMLKSWYIAFFKIPYLPDWLIKRKNFAVAIRSLQQSSRVGTFSASDILEYQKAWRNSNGMTGMINWYRALLRFPTQLPDDIHLHMPVRILWGKRDRFLSYQMAAASAQLCDQVEVTLFENASHWVQHEESLAVSQSLIQFFNQ